MTPPRLVVDTNVVLSALLFWRRSLSWMRRAWTSEQLVLLVSRRTAAELLRVLCYPKFGLDDEEREHLLADFLPWCEAVAVPEGLPVPDCRDPNDRPFLELAVHAGADALVTGDRDLLSLASIFSIPIVTPTAARDLLTEWKGR
ncbi:MAG: putative toxin-antitoxin system toxin component, PIN family [bacterium]|nr:putative toxin-antitoxin system toxin component, PIN family [bacterium]